jgi:hypothetical protein
MVRQEGSNVQMFIDCVEAVFMGCLLQVYSNKSFAQYSAVYYIVNPIVPYVTNLV